MKSTKLIVRNLRNIASTGLKRFASQEAGDGTRVPRVGLRARSERDDRLALAVFAVVEVAAFAIFFHIGMRSWFHWDDWDFLAARTAGDLHSLLAPHVRHWSTVPVLTYRVLWHFFGLRFAPYLATAVALHVVAAALLRVVMRRAGVGPWIATAAASLLALFGVGYQETAQLTALSFGGWPIVFGLSYLLLVDHDGPFDRRDGLGLVAGLGALASSALAVPMIVAVGIATSLRRGPRVAMTHMLPLGAVFAAWYIGYSYEAVGASISGIPRFVWGAGSGVFVELGQSHGAAFGLAILLVVGLGLAWAPLRGPELRVRVSLPVGLLLGAVTFLVITGYGRGDFGSSPRQSHYMEAAAVMVLPALAVAAQAVAHRVPVLAFVVPLVFLIGIPGNLAALDTSVGARWEGLSRQDEQLVLSLPRAPLAAKVPRSLVPEPLIHAPVTIGWLLGGLASGRVPATPQRPSPALDGEIELRLSLRQTNGLIGFAPCRSLRSPIVRELAAGQHIGVHRGSVEIALLRDSGWTADVKFGAPFAAPYFGLRGETLMAVRGPLTLRIAPGPGDKNSLCG